MQIGHMARWGIALIAVVGILDGSVAVAQSSPANGHAAPAPGPQPFARTPTQPPAGRAERSARDDRRPEPSYFERGSLQLALGAATFWERPAAQPEAATFLSAGLHLSPSLAVVGEMGRGWWARGRVETPSRAAPAAACPDIQAGFHTFMGGVQYRLGRVRRSTKFVQSSPDARRSPARRGHSTAGRPRAASTRSPPGSLCQPAEGWTFISPTDSRSASRRTTGASPFQRSKGRSACS